MVAYAGSDRETCAKLYGFTDRLLIVVCSGAVQCGVLEPSGLEALAMFLDDDRRSGD